MTTRVLQAGDGQSREVPVTDEACLTTKYHLKLEFSSFGAASQNLLLDFQRERALEISGLPVPLSGSVLLGHETIRDNVAIRELWTVAVIHEWDQEESKLVFKVVLIII
ncbi:hypothetical protein CFAM422_011046 [Trichoderma lentiforme]|uniref:Uncharacterized protein n=1 Tax=Trichoderma lentiforme TaxID=1567552 RepID=A0A9P4X6H0_9HYPO|nr:hypothetical protein CFAM422_011046 [Trichoderma lentiforme]